MLLDKESANECDSDHNDIEVDGSAECCDRLQPFCKSCNIHAVPMDHSDTLRSSVCTQGQTARGCVVTSPSDDNNSATLKCSRETDSNHGGTETCLSVKTLREELCNIEADMNRPTKRSKGSQSEEKSANVNKFCMLRRKYLSLPSMEIPEISALKEMVTVIFSLTAEQCLLFQPDYEGDTKLHLVIIFDLEDVALTIIDSVKDYELLDIQNQMFQTPLHLAVQRNLPVVARRLICCGAEVDSCDHNGNTPLHIACLNGNIKMAEVLMTPITHEEVRNNKISIPYRKIPQDLNIRNFEGETCMDIAFRNNNRKLIDMLFEKGADVNQRCLKTGRTLLYRACITGFVDLVKYLIQRNCNINARAYDGSTPFDAARACGHWQIAALLAERGAESDSDNE